MGTVGFPPGNRIPKDRKGEGMAVHIRNRSDLKMAYEVLMDMQVLRPLPGREEAVREHIRELKKDIREYFRQQEKDSERHIICDDGTNGYTELVRLPESLYTKASADSYFEEKEVLRCPDLPGECTGHPVTCWFGMKKWNFIETLWVLCYY